MGVNVTNKDQEIWEGLWSDSDQHGETQQGQQEGACDGKTRLSQSCGGGGGREGEV